MFFRSITWLLLFPQFVPGQTSILGTKHNLSASSGTGTIKAFSERQVCVFCHTPHSPTGSTQLWNHTPTAQTYTLYSSDYLNNLNYTTPNQPNPRSKLCLSCHDGTVALGAVYAPPWNGPREIVMANGVTTMPESSPGNLGVSLTNDHPVGFIYDQTRDNELVARSWPWNTSVKLDPDASNGTVECHTCHDPHNNENKKFLRMNNTNAALCTFCHNKTGWTTAIHRTSAQVHTPPGQAVTTVGEWACRNCHSSHGGSGLLYLLGQSEENTCYASGCHGSSSTGVNTKNIQSASAKVYSHPTHTVSGKHKNPDTQGSLDASNRHAECEDCHNLHQAKKGLHQAKSNVVSNVLFGARGVTPGSAASWTQPTMFTPNVPAIQENQICFKCHSYYAFGPAVNGVTNIIGPSGINITDQAMEFNPANRSAHPVQVTLNNQVGAVTPKALNANQMSTVWNSPGNQTMYCSDCHGNEQATSPTVPQGPHGSNSKSMLTGTAKYWPANASGVLWSLDDVRRNRNGWQTDLFCVNCHPLYTAGNFVNNVHGKSDHQSSQVKCITCHVAVPHGSKRSRLIGYLTDVSPYNYLGPGTYDRLVIIGFRKSARTSYNENNCSMNNGMCHGTQSGVFEP